MPGSTPKLALPYPLGTDPISDGDDQIKALAERVEAILSGTYATVAGDFTYASGVTTAGAGNKAWRIAHLVVWRVMLQFSANQGQYQTITTITKAGWTPESEARFVLGLGAGADAVGATINNQGQLTLNSGVSAGSSWLGTAVYVCAGNLP